MRKITLVLIAALCLGLTACTHYIKPYQPPVQQGNIFTDDMMKQLKYGMTKDQVAGIFGDPILINTFDNDTWSYVYTFQPSKGKSTEKQLTITFRNNRVANYTVSLPPPLLRHKR